MHHPVPVALALLSCLLVPSSAHAQKRRAAAPPTRPAPVEPSTLRTATLAPGDLIGVGPTATGPLIAVRIDPDTGEQTELYAVDFPGPYVAVGRDGYLYTTLRRGSQSRIERVELATGVQEVVSSGMHLVLPRGIAVEEDGSLLVADEQHSFLPPTDAILLRVDPATGAQSILAQDAFGSRPKDVKLDQDGSALVIDDTLWGAVFRVDPETGDQAVVSEVMQGSLIPGSLTFGIVPGGDLFAVGPGSTGLVRIDPATGEQFLSMQQIGPIVTIQPAPGGDLYLALRGGTVHRFDPETEAIVETVTSGGLLRDIRALAVVPAPRTSPVTCSVLRESLWPPSHDLVDVGLTVQVQHPGPVGMNLAVYSDEAHLEPGSGHTSPDADKGRGNDLDLRAERSGTGDGRVYLVVATVVDDTGVVGRGACTVVVPRNASPASLDAVQRQAAQAQEAFDMSGGPPRGFHLLVGSSGGAGARLRR